jgi:uncharacterized protein (TIGR03000 family)
MTVSRSCLAAVVFAAACAVAAGQPQAPAPARIVVKLPASAKLYVDNLPTTSEGTTRVIETPVLQPGEEYRYELVVETRVGGTAVRQQRMVSFRAGETKQVDFGGAQDPAGARRPVPPLPTKPGGPGNVIVAQVVGQGDKAEVRLNVVQFYTEQRERTRTVDGKTVRETYTVARPVVQTRSLKTGDVQAFRKDGTPIGVAELARLLAEPTQVILSTTGMIDPYFLGVVRDDVLILSTSPQNAYGAPPQTVPTPKGSPVVPKSLPKPKPPAAPGAARAPRGNAVVASPVLAGLDESGTVVIRQYLINFGLPVGPPPAKDGGKPAPPAAPPARVLENVLHFSAADVRAYDLDGNPVPAAKWKQALVKETPVLFSGYAILPATPAGKPAPAPAEETPLNVTPLYRAVFQPDTLILLGTRMPVKQEPGRTGAALPRGLAPSVAAAAASAGKFRLIIRDEHASTFPTTAMQKKGDRLVPTTIYVRQTNQNLTTQEVPLEHARVFGTDGQPVPADQFAARLTGETPVLMSTDGQPPDPLYLRLARPGTLVVVPPVTPGYMMAPTVAPPPPPARPAAPKAPAPPA